VQVSTQTLAKTTQAGNTLASVLAPTVVSAQPTVKAGHSCKGMSGPHLVRLQPLLLEAKALDLIEVLSQAVRRHVVH